VTPTPVYEAYGSMTYGAAVAQYGFGGQFGYYIDPETGLVLCGQRYYDPGAARWLTRDPLGYAGGVNLYAYCGNNPIGAADPDGTSPWWDNFFSARSPTMVDAQDLEMQYEMSKLDHDGDAGIAAAAVNASWSADLCRRQHSQAISGGTLNLATMAIPGLGEAGAAAEGFEGAEVAEEGVGAYLATKAPMQVTPGTSSLEGQYINDLGQVQPWKAHYDEFGRLVGRTDYNAANKAEGYAATHYHVYGYRGNPRSLGGQVLKIKSHIPGEFTP